MLRGLTYVPRGANCASVCRTWRVPSGVNYMDPEGRIPARRDELHVRRGELHVRRGELHVRRGKLHAQRIESLPGGLNHMSRGTNSCPEA
eukprot:269514-Prorocentrum_minimum.AAC.5